MIKSDRVQVSVRLKKELHRKVALQAAKERRSLSNYIESVLLRQYTPIYSAPCTVARALPKEL
jgi:HicB family